MRPDWADPKFGFSRRDDARAPARRRFQGARVPIRSDDVADFSLTNFESACRRCTLLLGRDVTDISEAGTQVPRAKDELLEDEP